MGGRGAPWGYCSGTKLDKLQGLMEVVVNKANTYKSRARLKYVITLLHNYITKMTFIEFDLYNMT